MKMARGFRNRVEAGESLAEELAQRSYEAPVVLGLARGGVVVAAPVAERLNAPLDVLVARKVGAPHHPEFGIGAVAPGGVSFVDENSLFGLGLAREAFERLAEQEHREVDRRLARYRRGAPPVEVFGRSAIMVDDGLATGVTAIAAARYLRGLGPRQIVLAVPVAAHESLTRLAREVDEVVCLLIPGGFYAVGQWYSDFSQVEDEDVVALLSGRQPR